MSANGIADRDVATATVAGQHVKIAGEGEQQLGDFLFIQVPTDTAVLVEELKEKAKQHGVNRDWLPSAPSHVSAFKRAAKELQNKDRHGETTEEGVRITTLVVDAKESPRMKFIVLERVEAGQKPHYVKLGVTEYDDTKGISFQCWSSIGNEVQAFEAMENRVRDRFAFHSTHFTARDMYGVLDRARRALQAVNLGKQSPNYFVPLDHREDLHRLVEFTADLGIKPYVFPLSTMQTRPEDVAERLVDAAEYEAGRIIKEIERAGGPSGMSDARRHGLTEDTRRLNGLIERYRNLLSLDLEAAQVKADMVKAALMKAALGDDEEEE